MTCGGDRDAVRNVGYNVVIVSDLEKKSGGCSVSVTLTSSPFSFSPNMVRKTVKLMGPLASLIMASSSSFFTFSWPEQSKDERERSGTGRGGTSVRVNKHSPMEASTSLRSSLLMIPSLFWSMIVNALEGD